MNEPTQNPLTAALPPAAPERHALDPADLAFAALAPGAPERHVDASVATLRTGFAPTELSAKAVRRG